MAAEGGPPLALGQVTTVRPQDIKIILQELAQDTSRYLFWGRSGSYFDLGFVGFDAGGPALGAVGIGASRLLAASPGVFALESVSGALDPWAAEDFRAL